MAYVTYEIRFRIHQLDLEGIFIVVEAITIKHAGVDILQR